MPLVLPLRRPHLFFLHEANLSILLSSPLHSRKPPVVATMTFPPNKRQKREEYRQAQTQAVQNESGEIKMPKKRFYRQRAHANPFSDHWLD
jgi:hypothetical protein